MFFHDEAGKNEMVGLLKSIELFVKRVKEKFCLSV